MGGKLTRLLRAAALLGTLVLLVPPSAAPPSVQAEPLAAPQPRTTAQATIDAPFAAGRLVVKFKPNLSGMTMAATSVRHNLVEARVIGRSGARVMLTEAGRELEVIQRLRADPTVEYAEPDYLVRAAVEPADSSYGSQWDLPKINMPAAWDITLGTSAVVVAVLDTGLDLSHPDLDSRWAYASGASPSTHVFVTAPVSGCPIPTTPDDDAWIDGDGSGSDGTFSHGTHVSGTIAAESSLHGDGGAGIAGIAPGVTLLPLKVLDCTGAGFISDVATAIEFAANRGAKVINMSLGLNGSIGGVDPGVYCSANFQSMQGAIDIAHAAGVVVVAAAGNSGSSSVSFPGGCNHVIAVGSTNSSDAVSSFSQHNATVDLVAPGEGILSTVRIGATSHDYGTGSGTSMATPHVAGCAALLLSLNPALTPDGLQAILQTTAVDLNTAPAAPGRDDYSGYGRLNCGAAVLQVASSPPAPTPDLLCGPVSATASPSGTGVVGTPVVATATETCASWAPQFQFWVRSPTGSWSVGQAFGSSNTFNWNTVALGPGTYQIAAYARSTGNAWSRAATTVVTLTAPTPTPTPTPTVAPPAPGGGGGGGGGGSAPPTATATLVACDPSYPDVCIPPPPPLLSCANIVFRNFRVLAPDPHGFDGDHNGIGCQAATPTPAQPTPTAIPTLSPTPVGGASISASPNPASNGSTTITWNTGTASSGQLWVSVDAGGEILFTSGVSGNAVAPWISSGHTYVFRLYSGTAHTQVLASVTVTASPPGSPSISASPNPIPPGAGAGTATITWTTGSSTAGEVWLSVNGAAEALFSRGTSGTGAISWINTGNSYRFTVYAGSSRSVALAQTTVTRSVSTGSISASPNPTTSGSTVVSFNSNSNGDTGQVYVSIDGGAEILVWQNPVGVEIAPWIGSGSSYRFTLYAGQGHLPAAALGSVTVTRT